MAGLDRNRWRFWSGIRTRCGIAAWLADCLAEELNLNLTLPECMVAGVAGWILGVG